MAALPPRQARAALAELTRASLLAEHAPGRFTCHDLLRAYAAECAQADDSDADRRSAIHRMLDHYLQTAYSAATLLHFWGVPATPPGPQPGVEPEQLATAADAVAWFEAERPVLMPATARALEAGFDTHAWQIPWAMARFLDMRGYAADWVTAEQTALAAAQRLGDRAAEAGAYLRLGSARAVVGAYQDAHAEIERALSIYTELGDLSGQAYAHDSLNMFFQFEDRNAEALGHAQQALELFTAAGDETGRAHALNAVGWMHARLGDNRQALRYCGQALDLLQGRGYRQLEAATWDSLGYAHHQLGDYAESAACYQRALEVFREIGDRLGQAMTLDHIGDAHQAAGRPQEARTAWEEALAILDGLHHPYAGEIRAKFAGPG